VVTLLGPERAPASNLVAPLLLVATGGCLALGGLLQVAGAGTEGDVAWVVGGVVGAAYSLWAMFDSLRHRRLGVDVIAFLALLGALLVSEYLAAAASRVVWHQIRIPEAQDRYRHLSADSDC